MAFAWIKHHLQGPLSLSAGKAKATPHFQFPQGMANMYKLIPGLSPGTSRVKCLAVSNHVCKTKVQ